MPTHESYQQIIRDLATLKASGISIFGSNAHHFTCSPVMSEAKILAFEKEHEVRLPDAYRSYLMTVGRGGAGPGYGLFNLGEMDDGFDSKSWAECDGFVGTLRLPFPHNDTWNDLDGEPDEALADTNEEEYWQQMALFEERYYSPLDGAIPICHHGCAIRQWLIVSGPEAGHIWDDDRANSGGLSPLTTASSTRVNFFEWYRGWLDEALVQIAQ